jgi:hypothetical protein
MLEINAASTTTDKTMIRKRTNNLEPDEIVSFSSSPPIQFEICQFTTIANMSCP